MNDINACPDEVLVVDDTPASLKLLEDILGGAGYRVRLATDGELALRSAKIQPPALVLLDIRMPGMDGYEVCQRLKDDKRTRAVPIIFLSALEDESEKVKGFQAGGVDYINKPIRAAELLARVGTHLALRHAHDELERRVAERTAELSAANERLVGEIEDRKRTEETLRQSEQKFRAVFDQTFQFIGMLAVDGTVLKANQTALRAAGVSEDAVLGKPFWETPWWAHSAEMQEKVRAAVLEAAAGKLVQFEATHVLPDGQVRTIDFSIKPITDAEGRIVQLIPEGRDITERKQAEEERKAHIHFLESLERIDQATKKTMDVEQMLWNITREVSSIFDCDRAWLFYPCDPDALTFHMPIMTCKPEYSIAKALEARTPISTDMIPYLREALASDDPVTCIAGTDKPINTTTAE